MARMIPPVPVPETPDSERHVYERFQSVLPDAWTVIHSQRFLLPKKRRAWEGELDFLLLDPSRGAIGLEVKGGGVTKTAAGWFSVDRHGTRHAIKDPGRQASDAVHAIRKYVTGARGFGGKGFRCGFGWGVVLPDIESPVDMGPDLPRDVILDRSDFAHLRDAVDRVFVRHVGHGQPLSEAGAEAFVSTLVERCPPASRLAVQFTEENQELWRLTEEQMTLLDSLAAHDRAAIEGAAGTGKTLLAMEKARRLATTGKRVLLLCFNSPLAQDLAGRAIGFEVETFPYFCRRLASLAGVGFDRKLPRNRQLPRDKATRLFAEEAPKRLREALARLPDERYDAIVVDEAQDFRPNWWPCLDEALRAGRDGTLYAFYDPNQDLHDGGPPRSLGVIEHKLVHNCRNTTRIASYVARLLGAEPHVRVGTPEGEQVEEVTCLGDADVVQTVTDWLDRLVFRENVDPDAIAIVSTRTLKNSPFARDHRAGRFELVNLDNRGRRTNPASSARHVVFDTLYRFKGLERDVVILLDLPGGDLDYAVQEGAPSAQRTYDDSPRVTARHRYVAASRARNLLVVVHLVRQPPS